MSGASSHAPTLTRSDGDEDAVAAMARGDTRGLADLVDRHDIGMVESSRDARFVEAAVEERNVTPGLNREEQIARAGQSGEKK